MDYRALIEEIRRDVIPVCASINIKLDPMRVTMADAYEIRNLDKAMVKKIREEEVISLITYGENYLEQYHEGKFLYKKGSVDKLGRVSTTSGRTLLADFDEAEAFEDILNKVKLLKEELNHK